MEVQLGYNSNEGYVTTMMVFIHVLTSISLETNRNEESESI